MNLTRTAFSRRKLFNMKYITVKLTQDQVYAIIRDLEFEMNDRPDTAFEQRIVTKLHKALAQAKQS
jgi:hypothetical protein